MSGYSIFKEFAVKKWGPDILEHGYCFYSFPRCEFMLAIFTFLLMFPEM